MLYTIASYKTKEEDKMDNIKVNFDNVEVTEKKIMKNAESLRSFWLCMSVFLIL